MAGLGFSFEVMASITKLLESAGNEECGGFLGGNMQLVRLAIPIRNSAEQPELEWRCRPEDQAETVRYFEERGLELIGGFHSHPQGSVKPSPEDVRAAESVGPQLIVATGAGEWTWRILAVPELEYDFLPSIHMPRSVRDPAGSPAAFHVKPPPQN